MNEQNTNPEITGKQVKRIDMESGVFTANGKTYRIEGLLSMERYAEYNALEKELIYGMDSKAMFKELRALWTSLEKQQFATCSVKVFDMLKAVELVMHREATAIKMCTLFINTDDEDRTVINTAIMTAKINDWRAEGIAAQDFFTLASSSVNGFHEFSRTITRIVSGQEQPGMPENQ
jgi:hypothetical protein